MNEKGPVPGKMTRMESPDEKSGFGVRMWRAAKLEAALFDEVKADADATGQAMAVVVLATLASSLGQADGFKAILIHVLLNIGLWYLGAGMAYGLGIKVFPEPGVQGEIGGVLRAIGFSSAPGLILILSFFPDISGLIFFIGFVWVMVADVIAIRQSLNFRSTFRAFGIWLISMFVQMFVYFRLASWLGVLPAS